MSQHTDTDPLLLRIFETEVSEGLLTAQSCLIDIEAGRGDTADLIEDVLRIAHNLKGSARVAGLEELGTFVHALEARLQTWRDLDPTVDSDIDLALRSFDLVGEFAQAPDDEEIRRRAQVLSAELGGKGDAGGRREANAPAGAAASSDADAGSAPTTVAHPSARGGESHRVSRLTIDAVRDRVSDVLGGMFEAHANLKGLERAMGRFIGITLPDGIDSRLVESRKELRLALAGLRPVLHRLDKETRELEERTRALCLVPVQPLVVHLERVVRDTARELAKEVRLEVQGGDVDMDVELVESFKGPLAHILRNAVDHGIESDEVRATAGKPACGLIELTLRQRGDRVIVTVRDDGAGIDVAAVRRRLGPMAEGMSDHDLCQTVLMAGFSTREQATEISGRGIGLGAVAQLAAEMRGHVEVTSRQGRGTTITVDLPLNLSIVHGVSVRAGGVHLVLPESGLTGVGDASTQGVRSLASVLGLPPDAPGEVVGLRGRTSEVSVTVSAIDGPVEVVRRDLGEHLGKLPFISGAAILEQGQPALIVDLHAVADACEGVVSPVTGPTRGRILLVDDSATLRARLAGELVQAGFEVDTADDGEQALARLDHGDFDAVVSDVQMPRLDGLQLLERIAGRLPVILATSYPEPEDEHRALCLGARAYLSKDDHTCREVVRILHLTLSTRAEPSP